LSNPDSNLQHLLFHSMLFLFPSLLRDFWLKIFKIPHLPSLSSSNWHLAVPSVNPSRPAAMAWRRRRWQDGSPISSLRCRRLPTPDCLPVSLPSFYFPSLFLLAGPNIRPKRVVVREWPRQSLLPKASFRDFSPSSASAGHRRLSPPAAAAAACRPPLN
jgi:hypothetical protein